MISGTSTTEGHQGGHAAIAARVGLGLLFTLAALWIIQYPMWPLSGDQGLWLWVGEVITEGGWPYVDAWDFKGPLPYYVGAVTHLLFGRTEWGIRVVDLAFVAGACFAIARLPMVRQRTVATLAAPLFFLFWYGSFGVWRTAQPDGWAGILILLAVGAVLGRGVEPGARRYLACGILMAAAALVKPSFAIFLLLPVLIAFAHRHGWTMRMIRGPAAAVLGFVLSLGVVAAIFAAAGALDEFIDADFLYVLGTYRDSDAFTGGPLQGFLGLLRQSPFWLAIPVVLIGLRELWLRDRPASVLIAGWIVLALAHVAVQNKYWQYHGLPVLLPLAVAAGIGTDRIGQFAGPSRQGSAGWRAAAAVLLAAAGVQAMAAPVGQTATSLRMLAGLLPDDAIGMKNPGIQSRGPDSLSGIAAYVRDRTEPGQAVLAMSNLVAVNYLADRPSPSRFGMTRGLLDGGDTPHRRRYREEFQAALAQHPPEYLILPGAAVCAAAEIDSFAWRNCLNDYPWLEQLRRTRYRWEANRGAFDIFRRDPDAGS